MNVSVFVCLLLCNLAYGSSIPLSPSHRPRDLPQCNADNRDCSCSDKAYRECDVPKATSQARAGSRGECKQQCDLASILTGCEWYMYNKDASGDEACLMFSKDAASMEDFVRSCDRTMMPVRKADGSCTASATNPTSGECSSLICPDGCVPCDETDSCNVNYHEAGCSLISPTVTSLSTPDLDFCLAVCATTGLSSSVTYADFNILSNDCDCHETGARRCSLEIVKRVFTEEEILSCTGEETTTTTTAIATTTTTTSTTTDTEYSVCSGPFGGNGGAAFSDEEFSAGRNITAVRIFAGVYIGSIQVYYNGQAGPAHGKNNWEDANEILFEVPTGTVIVSASGTTGDHHGSGEFMKSIEFFTTSDGQVHGPFGQGSDNPWTANEGENCELGFFEGRSGSIVDQLSLCWRCRS